MGSKVNPCTVNTLLIVIRIYGFDLYQFSPGLLCETSVIPANNKAKEAESKARNLETKLGDKSTKDQRVRTY